MDNVVDSLFNIYRSIYEFSLSPHQKDASYLSDVEKWKDVTEVSSLYLLHTLRVMNLATRRTDGLLFRKRSKATTPASYLSFQ